MEALCGMFAQVDRAVVEVVLESHGGNVEQAIDHLLQMTAEQEAAAAAAEAEAERQRAEEAERAAREAEEAAEAARWRKPLPRDFLRLPEDVKVRLDDAAQIQRDELFAQLLANEGFRRELAQHAEFEHSAHEAEGFDWLGAWNGLGEAARVKFGALAAKFQRSQAYEPVDESDPYMDAMFPSNGASARNRRRQGGDGTEGGGSGSGSVEMGALGPMSRMKIQ